MRILRGAAGKTSPQPGGLPENGSVSARRGREILSFRISKKELASYDDSGVTGHKSCYVLEEGSYGFYVGTDVRSTSFAGAFVRITLTVTERLEEALAPVTPFPG